MGLRCGGTFVQSASSKTIRPDVNVSSPAMQRRTVVFPAAEGPNKIVIEDALEIRMEASTRRPPSNCLTMSAVSSKEPPLSIECVNDRKNHAGNNEQQRGCCGG